MLTLRGARYAGPVDLSTGAIKWEPDIVGPSQWADRHGNKRTSPEKRLMLAILEDAVNVLDTRARQKPPLVQQTLEWIESDDVSWLFAFVRICDALNLDASYLRRGIRAAMAREPARPRLALVVKAAAMPTERPWTADRVKALRQSLGFSARQFAYRVRIGASTVYEWEYGNRPVLPAYWPVLTALEESAR